MKQEYLGDGLYVSFHGGQIELRAPRYDGDDKVYLEKETYLKLKQFADTIWGLE